MLADWLESLRHGVEEEFGDRPRLVTLATATRGGSPRARMCVCRSIDDEGTHLFVSDARSEKNQQLRARQEAEVVHWLPGRRLQFRLRGAAAPAAGIEHRVWAGLSDATRAMFFWPPPGSPRVEGAGAFPQAVSSDVEPPAAFEVIAFIPMEVERLDLNPHPHDRRRWAMARDWQEEWLNP